MLPCAIWAAPASQRTQRRAATAKGEEVDQITTGINEGGDDMNSLRGPTSATMERMPDEGTIAPTTSLRYGNGTIPISHRLQKKKKKKKKNKSDSQSDNEYQCKQRRHEWHSLEWVADAPSRNTNSLEELIRLRDEMRREGEDDERYDERETFFFLEICKGKKMSLELAL
jgi:hypothetical protein